jgi:hypothetical protein
MIDGFKTLQKTYTSGNVVFTLQLYINLLNSGIDGTYDQKLLPEHLKNIKSDNLLDDDKIKNIWSDTDIIEFGKILIFCFEKSEKNSSFAYKQTIKSFLTERDEIFKKKIEKMK